MTWKLNFLVEIKLFAKTILSCQFSREYIEVLRVVRVEFVHKSYITNSNNIRLSYLPSFQPWTVNNTRGFELNEMAILIEIKIIQI